MEKFKVEPRAKYDQWPAGGAPHQIIVPHTLQHCFVLVPWLAKQWHSSLISEAKYYDDHKDHGRVTVLFMKPFANPLDCEHSVKWLNDKAEAVKQTFVLKIKEAG